MCYFYDIFSDYILGSFSIFFLILGCLKKFGTIFFFTSWKD